MATRSFSVLFAALTAALASLLFGYQTAIISGALPFIASEFQLTPFQEGMVVSIVLIGGVLGALLGKVADKLGRKRTLFLIAILYLLFTCCLGEASRYLTLLLGRFCMGLAVGMTSVVVPLYIAEIAPPERRGALVSIAQLMTTVGILLSYGIAYLFAAVGDWRQMFYVALIPPALQFALLFFIPDTPARIATPKTEEKLLWSKSMRAPLLIGIGLNVVQQITGINTVIYYGSRIFQHAGSESPTAAIYATVWIGVVNVVMTLLGLWLCDRAGRRTLVLTGFAGMALSLFALGYTFQLDEPGLWALLSLAVYIASFAIGPGLVTAILVSEIYPLPIRASGMSIAFFTNWSCNYLVSLLFLPMVEWLSIGGTYWIYAAFSLLAFGLIWRKVPETKGKTFEEIQLFWHK